MLKSLLRTLPRAEYVYLGDSARTPYGTKSKETVVGYSFECAEFLLQHDIDLLVIACNTASAAALSALKAQLTIPVFGMIEPASHDAVSSLDQELSHEVSDMIAVIGTEGTIQSRVYDSFIHQIRPGTKVIGQSCPLFVPVIEQGIFDGPIIDEVLKLYLSELKDIKPASLILACTHYPLLRDAIQDFIGPQTRLISCSDSLSQHLGRLYAASGQVDEKSNVKFFTTDSVERFDRLGAAILASTQVRVGSTKIQL